MRTWMIGCGVVLVIAVALAAFFGNMLYRQFRATSDKIGGAVELYESLEAKHPFEPEWGRKLTSGDMERFLACRKEVALRLDELVALIEDEDTSSFEKMTQSIDIIPSLAEVHAGSLERLEMSPDEYLWLLGQVLVVLRYAEAEDAPEELRRLRALLDGGPSRPGSGEGAAGPAKLSKGANALLPLIEPWQIQMAEENLEAVLMHGKGLEETLPVFFYFDPHFRDTFLEIHTAKVQETEGQDPPPEPAGKEIRSDK